MFLRLKLLKFLFRVLKFLDTTSNEYSIIFTLNTTHALKLVAETFQYNTKLIDPKMGALEDLASLCYFDFIDSIR